MQEIAKRSEFAIGTLYKFFKNKEDLYRSMIIKMADTFHTALTRALSEEDDEIEVNWVPGTPLLSVEWDEVTDVVELTQDIEPDELPDCIDGPADLIVGYEAVFELVVLEDDEEQVYKETAILPADAEIFTASPEFTQLAVEAENAAIGGTIEGAELKVEVIAKEESGNSTITEIGVFELPVVNGD